MQIARPCSDGLPASTAPLLVRFLFTAVFLILILSPFFSDARFQGVDSLWRSAEAYEARYDDELALECVLKVLDITPDNGEALIEASRLYSRLGGREQDEEEKKEKVMTAKSLALRAIALDTNRVEAHFQLIVALGMLSEMAKNPGEKLEHARLIRQECARVLRRDCDHAGTHYIMGKWHHGLSRLSWFERLIVEAIFGGVPAEASSSEAYRFFKRAIDLQPDYILFRYGLATMLADTGRPEEAIEVLEQALLLPDAEPDDAIRKANCRRLLNRVRSEAVPN